MATVWWIFGAMSPTKHAPVFHPKPATVAGLGISKVLGRQAPQSARRSRPRVSRRACNTRSRRSKAELHRAGPPSIRSPRGAPPI